MGLLSFSAITLPLIGTLMLAFILISVHERFKEDRAIDQSVIDQMNKEQVLGVIAIIFIATGWALSTLQEFEYYYTDKRQEAILKYIVKHRSEKRKRRH
jgi:hypothetical protein